MKIDKRLDIDQLPNLLLFARIQLLQVILIFLQDLVLEDRSILPQPPAHPIFQRLEAIAGSGLPLH